MPRWNARPSVVRAHLPSAVVVAVGLLATALVTWQLGETTRAKDEVRFQGSVQRVQDEIRKRLSTYEGMMHAAAGLLAAEPDLSAAEFRAFVERLQLPVRFPGIRGIGFSRRLLPGEVPSFVARQKIAGRPDFRIWPEHRRNEYHTILYLEPLDDRNSAAVGYDMFTEPIRRAAMERARDTGRPATSGRVTLVQETTPEKQPGFLIYLPVYRGGLVPERVEERRARLLGFIYAPFRAGDLFAGIFSESKPRVAFELYDRVRETSRLVYRSGTLDGRPRFTAAREMEFGGHVWSLSLSSTEALEEASSRNLVPIAALAGIAITGILAALLALQTRERLRVQRSEAALAESSERFRQLANSISQLVWMAQPDGYIYWYNDRWYAYTGTTPEQMRGWGWQSVHDPAVLPRVLDAWKGAIARGEPFEMEFPLRGADGKLRWFLTRAVPVRDAQGRIAQWFGTNTDVQSQHDAETELKEYAERLEVLNRTGARLTAELELEPLVQAVTDAGIQLTRAQFGVFSPTSTGDRVVRSDDVTTDPRFEDGTLPALPADLRVRSYLAAPVVARSGARLGGLYFVHEQPAVFTQQMEDIIAGIAAQAAIAIDNARLYNQVQGLLARERMLRAEAERVSQMKDEFLATLSHELRTPLNAIIGWTQLLIDGNRAEEARQKALVTIQRNARAQARLIDDLLDMSRIISGKVRLDLREVDVCDVIESALNVVRPTAVAKGVHLDTALSAEFPRVMGDANRLQQIAWNLLTNAIKFTPAGGRVQVTLERAGGRVTLAVSDTGVGIEPGFLPFVFDRFRQADGSTTRQHGGLGLGLSIVKSLTEMHGGTVTARSPGPDRGATFTVSLPEAGPHSLAAHVVERRGHPATSSEQLPALQGARVLVVDDDEDALELTQAILQEHLAEVVVVRSAADALTTLQSRPADFDVLVSDLAMPGMDGFELVQRLRAAEHDGVRALPAIALSAYARREDQIRAVEVGYHAHVSKPFDPAKLVAACVSALQSTERAG